MDKEQILYEDKDILVCHKPAGIATQTAKVGQRDMVSEVSNHLAAALAEGGRFKSDRPPYVGLVHRLDQLVEGILVFAKNPKSAKELSRQITEDRMEKYYYAVVCMGEEAENKGRLVDYLRKDNAGNISSVVTEGEAGAKRAELFYEVIEFCRLAGKNAALVRIKLITGRHHQIRVQMSHAGMALLGDYKYADDKTKALSEAIGQKQVALCAYKLVFKHPVSGKQLSFQKEPEGIIFQNFSL